MEMRIEEYLYGTDPSLVPIGEQSGMFDGYDELVAAAGFDPDDEEVTVCLLAEEFDGHPAGSLVITGQATENCRFAIADDVFSAT